MIWRILNFEYGGKPEQSMIYKHLGFNLQALLKTSVALWRH